MYPAIEHLARRTQEVLYEAFNWPHLIVERDIAMVPGERYYTFETTVNRDRILGAYVKWSQSWVPVRYGFDSSIYNASMPEDTYRADPVQLWRFYEGAQYEVWPNPASAQTLRWRFVRHLNPLIASTDYCDLDANLIVMFAAAELLQRMKSPDAESKNKIAQSHLMKIKAQLQRTTMFTYGGAVQAHRSQDWTLRTRPITDLP